MASIEFTVTRETEDDSRDITLMVEYTYSAYGIDAEVVDSDVVLTADEMDDLYGVIREWEHG